ncbi:metallo-beta-lactamase domain-containing protein 1-like [Teleopsis dalmanni]|uniref:metallo-beta-lactamase domain-containing protein 1-like n=1 Tax=Teleopsis dalmanni TaxID=139649 RepID=UPI0018CCBD41|nr:metallo-beta-lactamase domain-containing protein 1-like [Teleopsis dalmanni]XP_037950608.1 metallo-beta-lactamase domain-containing protein 1-like [Teleopsis dalmanni]
MCNQVFILFTGYSHIDVDEPSAMRANCTCTLIRTSSGKNIIVDTMTAWDGDKIVTALREHNLQPLDIHIVVCTHGHSDHIGCNYLFQNAKWHFVGNSISHRDKYIEWSTDDSASFAIDGIDVAVQQTPGHTLSCVSVIAGNTPFGTVGVCGDLFERAEDIFDETLWLEAGSEDATKQRQQRLRMAELCAYIIPGHGPGFKVTDKMLEKLRSDAGLQSISLTENIAEKLKALDNTENEAVALESKN